MAEQHDTRGARRRALVALNDDGAPFPINDLAWLNKKKNINDLPNDVLVSIFEAVEDLTWVRHTVPLVCKAWACLLYTSDAADE